MRIYLGTKSALLTYPLFAVIIIVLQEFSISEGLPLDLGRNVGDAVSHPTLVRQDMPERLQGTFDLSSVCDPGIELHLSGKRLNVRNLQFSAEDALILAPSLYDQTLEERCVVWCKMAELNRELAASIGRNVTSFDVKEFDRYQGDIILTMETVDVVLGDGPYRLGPRTLWPTDHNPSWDYLQRKRLRQGQGRGRRVKRKVLSDLQYYWRGAVVPWRFGDNGAFSSAERTAILEGIASWEQKTCLRFPETPNPGSSPHIRFIRGSGCWSYIGKLARGQDISIGNGCSNLGIITHEIGHAIGFSHEQSRPDRNRYVEINFSNVQPGFECNFFSGSWLQFQTANVPYDYASVMHYAYKDFGQNRNLETVMTLDPAMRLTIGQRIDLSFWDVQLANRWYCSERCQGSTLEWNRCENEGYRNPNNCGQCICPPGLAPPFCEELQTSPPVCESGTFFVGDGTGTFRSPGYGAVGSPVNTECVYMFRTLSNRRIRMRFTGSFGIEEAIDRACMAFVEIRYQNMALAGPRYCGFTTPTDVFVSHGSTILVTFYTQSRRNTGFQLEYSAESCGGCFSNEAQSEPACLRTKIDDCDVTVGNNVLKNRCYDVLPDNKRYCCSGYSLSGENCERSTATPPPLPPPPTAMPPLPPPPPPPPPPSGWTEWSAWSGCSATCGLCGMQTRTRSCRGPPCPGSRTQSRRCATRTCPPRRGARICFTPFLNICYFLVSRPCCAGQSQSGKCV